jgi:hypothetical protein
MRNFWTRRFQSNEFAIFVVLSSTKSKDLATKCNRIPSRIPGVDGRSEEVGMTQVQVQSRGAVSVVLITDSMIGPDFELNTNMHKSHSGFPKG